MKTKRQIKVKKDITNQKYQSKKPKSKPNTRFKSQNSRKSKVKSRILDAMPKEIYQNQSQKKNVR